MNEEKTLKGLVIEVSNKGATVLISSILKNKLSKGDELIVESIQDIVTENNCKASVQSVFAYQNTIGEEQIEFYRVGIRFNQKVDITGTIIELSSVG